MGITFLVILDSNSMWPEVYEMSTTTTAKAIKKLLFLFASYGLLQQEVTDNGPQFTLQEFKIFMKKYGITHTKCAPYHPSSNGAVEQFNQTFKQPLGQV